MASFNTAYGLCSLIDQKGLLGVSTDEAGCALITLGKNIVIRCRLSDQKQLTSWSSTQKLTAKVVYNSDEDIYTGIFDGLIVKQWKKTDTNIDKMKKHKCNGAIHEILVHKKDSHSRLIILKKSGASVELNSFLNQQIDPTESILEDVEIVSASTVVQEDKDYLVLITKSIKKKGWACVCAMLTPDTLQVHVPSVKHVWLRRPDAKLLGYTVMSDTSSASLKTFWSDEFLYTLDLPLESAVPEAVPGKFCGTISGISCKSAVAMAGVGSVHFVIYGGDCSEEGAVLGIYNINLGMMQVHAKFKMLHKPPRLWVIEDRVAVAMGQRLVCVPYILQTENLSALVGSRSWATKQVQVEDGDIVQFVPSTCWEQQPKSDNGAEVAQQPLAVKKVLDKLRDEGWSEANVSQAVLDEVLQAGDVEALTWCVDHFVDIPSELLARLMEFTLSRPDSFFEEVQVMEVEGSHKNPIESPVRSRLVNKILTIPTDRTTLMDTIRSHLTLESSLLFLRYTAYLVTCASLQTLPNVFLWCFTIMDGFFQQLVLSRDPDVMHTLDHLMDAVDQHVSSIDEMKALIPILVRLSSGKDLVDSRQKTINRYYSVERIQINN